MAVDLQKRLGSRIRQIRSRAGITQAQLAERVDISPEFMSRLERGQKAPRLNTAGKIADALGITMVELFEFDQVDNGEKDDLLSAIQSLLATAEPDTLRLVLEVNRTIINNK